MEHRQARSARSRTKLMATIQWLSGRFPNSGARGYVFRCGLLSLTSFLHKPSGVLLVLIGNPVGAEDEVMDDARHGREADSCHADVFSSSLPGLARAG